jgi:small subunit ribosomal protein S5
MEGTTIPHEIIVHWDGATVMLKPAPVGTGIIAGAKVRDILMAAGISDVVAKNLGGTNPINQVKATFKAFEELSTRADIKEKRGL